MNGAGLSHFLMSCFQVNHLVVQFLLRLFMLLSCYGIQKITENSHFRIGHQRTPPLCVMHEVRQSQVSVDSFFPIKRIGERQHACTINCPCRCWRDAHIPLATGHTREAMGCD